MTAIVSALNKVVSLMSHYSAAVAGAAIALMMFLTGADVLLRYVFIRPIAGSIELTEFMMSVLVGFGLVCCAVEKGHVRVDMVLTHIPQNKRKYFDLIGYIISVGFYCLIVWRVFLHAGNLLNSKLVSSTLFIPVYPFVYLLVIALVLLALVFFKNIFECFQETKKT